MSSFVFMIPNFRTLIVDELKQHKEWVSMQFTGMTLQNTSKKTEKEIILSVKDIQLTDLTMPINQCLIGQKKKGKV
jgi:hypothetical protein